MARPMKAGLDYFPHDCDALSDEKIEALVMLHGPAGYMFYFIMLEKIYKTQGFELNISDAETGEEIRQIFARKLQVTIQEFDKILSTALKWGCFDRDAYEKRGVLTSNGIKKRAGVVVKKREKMRAAHYESVQLVSDAETNQKPARNPEKTGERKEKKSKVYIYIIPW